MRTSSKHATATLAAAFSLCSLLITGASAGGYGNGRASLNRGGHASRGATASPYRPMMFRTRSGGFAGARYDHGFDRARGRFGGFRYGRAHGYGSGVLGAGPGYGAGLGYGGGFGVGDGFGLGSYRLVGIGYGGSLGRTGIFALGDAGYGDGGYAALPPTYSFPNHAGPGFAFQQFRRPCPCNYGQ